MSAERAKMEEELFAAEHARRAAITRGDMAAIVVSEMLRSLGA